MATVTISVSEKEKPKNGFSFPAYKFINDNGDFLRSD